MKRFLHCIPALFAAALVLVSSCSKEGPRVIPRSKLARIYAEMLVTDQWIQSRPALKNIADTSLVYEPILEKYGFTSEDYQYSVDHYMNDPERFSRILRTTASILDKEIRSLKKQQQELKEMEIQKKEVEKFEMTFFQFYDDLVYEDGARGWSDSLDVQWDTVYNAYRFRRMPRTDTVYDGPRMIVAADTLAVADSLAVTDSLVSETGEPVDSVGLQKTVAKIKKSVMPDLSDRFQNDSTRRNRR